MWSKLVLTCSLFTFAAFADFQEQSRFIGPLNLRVWNHWQPSWNVESNPTRQVFTLVRSIDGEKGQVSLTLHDEREAELAGPPIS